MADERGHGVLDRAVADRAQRGEAGAVLERQHLAAGHALPLVGVALVAAVGGVHADEDVGLDDLLPERVELGQRERARPAESRDRRGADQDDLGAALDDPLELLDAPSRRSAG